MAGERLEQALKLKRFRRRCAKAARSGKSAVLNEFCAATGYHPKYANALLNRPADEPVKVRKRRRGPAYSEAALGAKETVWKAAGYPWSHRPKALLPLWLPWLRRRLPQLTPAVAQEMLRISARQLDRRLQGYRRQAPVFTVSCLSCQVFGNRVGGLPAAGADGGRASAPVCRGNCRGPRGDRCACAGVAPPPFHRFETVAASRATRRRTDMTVRHASMCSTGYAAPMPPCAAALSRQGKHVAVFRKGIVDCRNSVRWYAPQAPGILIFLFWSFHRKGLYATTYFRDSGLKALRCAPRTA